MFLAFRLSLVRWESLPLVTAAFPQLFPLHIPNGVVGSQVQAAGAVIHVSLSHTQNFIGRADFLLEPL